MANITLHRRVDAPADIVWDVITDHELYADVAPNLSSVDVLSGDRVGMVRRCVDTNGNEWTETCTRWEEGRGFAVSVDVPESAFHRRLFSRFEGEWRLDEHAEGVDIVMRFDFDPRFGPLGILISKFFAYKAPGLVATIFDRWEDEIEARDPGLAPEDDQFRAIHT